MMEQGRPAVTRKTIDKLLSQAEQYELVGETLFRKVFEPVDNEVQLRLVVPSGPAGKFDIPGIGVKPLGYREKVLLDCHNGPFGAHQGRDRTYEIVS
jgi:hypothetical protein